MNKHLFSHLGGLALIGTMMLSSTVHAGLGKVMDRDDAQAFVKEMQDKHGIKTSVVEGALSKAKLRDDIIKLMTRPAEGKPWKDYRKIFITKQRIEGGKKFCKANAHWLGRAEEVYGVPPEIITALIGVETRYGNVLGRHRVIDALSTLAFAYPPRSKFFRSELSHFFRLADEEKWDPLKPKGSYAGAMGWGQFIPSSYRAYAIDFDKDGTRDLWNSTPDIVGSIANYLKRHGWRQGDLIAGTAKIKGNGYKQFIKKGLKPSVAFPDLAKNGVTTDMEGNAKDKVLFMDLNGENGHEYWLGFHNFYIITRYNHSHRYAMVVHQLASKIRSSCLNLDERDAATLR